MSLYEKTAKELAAMKDSDIDFSDNPATDKVFWKVATMREFERPEGETIALPVIVDSETRAYFERRGSDLSAVMSAALKEYADTHR